LAVRQLKWHVSWVSETLHMSPVKFFDRCVFTVRSFSPKKEKEEV
jgi:hypothetical protein